MLETFKFLQMRKQDEDSMATYQGNLQRQAEKCGIKCCLDRTIRDRLIQAITEEDILPEVVLMTSPSAADVVALVDGIVKDQKVFSLVMPYLVMSDIAVLSKVSLRLQRIVRRYVKKGGSVTIDEHVLGVYPVESNPDFYAQFGDALSVTLKGIAEDNIPELMSCFKETHKFAMVDMEILDGITGIPRSLKELTLINVRIEHDLLNELIRSNDETLESLHFERIESTWSYNDHASYLLQACHNLKKFVAKQYHHFRFDDNLKIVSNGFCDWQPFPSQLEHIHLGGRFNNCCDEEELNQLKSLTFTIWTGQEIPPTVKYLRILQPLDYKFKQDIDRLNIKSVEVIYYNVPATEVPRPNLILEILNDDCLLKVAEYLSIDECIAFSKVHPRIYTLITRQGVSDLKLEQLEPNQYQNDSDFFMQVAPFLRKICADDNLVRILPYCSGLRSLSYDGSEQETATLFNQIEENSSMLSNLKELTCSSATDRKFLMELLDRNRKTLEMFSFSVNCNSEWAQTQPMWLNMFLIVKFPNFKHLKLVGYSSVTDQDDQISAGLFVKQIFGLVERQLETLTLNISGFGISDLIDATYCANLKELNYVNHYELTELDLEVLTSFKKLTKITLDDSFETWEIQDSSVLRLVKALPDLVEIVLGSSFNFSLRFARQLNDLLQREGRTLRIISLVPDIVGGRISGY